MTVLYDQQDEGRYIPFNNLGPQQAHYEVINSMLSERLCSVSNMASLAGRTPRR